MQTAIAHGSIVPPMPTNPAVLEARARGIAKVLSFLSKKANREFTMSTKTGRLELQKVVYLLKRLDNPSAKKFEYNIYLNGPYSPELAEVYYAIGDEGVRNATPSGDLSSGTIETVVDALRKGPDFLEALTTVLDGERTLGTFAASMSWAKSIKPHLADQTWTEVRLFLKGHANLTRST